MAIADPQHRLDGEATLGVGNGPVDLAEGIELYQAAKWKLPCPVQVDQFGDESLRHRVSLNDAEGFSPF